MSATRSRSLRNRLATPFWNDEQGRIRALWRIVGAVVLALAVPGILYVIVVQPLDPPLLVDAVASQLLYTATTVALLVAWARYVDRRPLAAYGFALDRRWVGGLALGAAIGLLGWGGALATDLLLGWATIESVLSPGTGSLSLWVALALGVVQYSLVGFWEEVVFRGIVMRNAIEGLNVPRIPRRWALVGGWVLSSVLFGVLHFAQATSLLSLGFWILAGLVLGLAYLLTDELAVPIGLHAAFDVSVNYVYGLAAASPDELVDQIPMLVRPAFTGPQQFVGIAGVVNTVWLLVMAGALVAVFRAREGSLRPRFSTAYLSY